MIRLCLSGNIIFDICFFDTVRVCTSHNFGIIMNNIETKGIFNLIHKQTKTISSLLIDHNDKALHESKKLFEKFKDRFAAQSAELEQNTQWEIALA